MNTLEPYQGSGLSTRTSRQVSRAVGKIEAGGSLRLARMEMEAEVQTAAVDAVTYVARRAMQDVAMLSQVEQQLAQAVPLATSRLEAVGNLATLAIGEVMGDTVGRLRRC